MKRLKKLLSCLSSIAVLMTCTAFVSADQIYDLNNEAYIKYINDNNLTERIENEDLLIYILSDGKSTTEGSSYKHVYKRLSTFCPEYSTYAVEKGNIDETEYKSRNFLPYFHIMWTHMINYEDENFCKEYSKNDINEFLTSNKFDVKIDENKAYDKNHIYLTYGEEMTDEDAVEVAYVLYNEYKLTPNFYIKTITTMPFTEEVVTSLSTFDTTTIAGDIDLNNEQGISDIVTLTKYNTSPDLYPITDPTALANADMNRDGAVNTLDTSILIEIALGTYESAF